MTTSQTEQREKLLSNLSSHGIAEDSCEVIVEGEMTLKKIRSRRTFDEWVTVGRGCDALQAAVMRASNSTNSSGRRYADKFEEIAPPELRTMDKSDRSYAIKLFEDADLIKAWYFDDNINSASARDRMQHPRTILDKYKDYLKKKQQTEQPEVGDEEETGRGKFPDAERRQRSAAAAIDDAAANITTVTDKLVKTVLPTTLEPQLDSTRAMAETWETMASKYGHEAIVSFLQVGLEQLPEAMRETTADTPESTEPRTGGSEPSDTVAALTHLFGRMDEKTGIGFGSGLPQLVTEILDVDPTFPVKQVRELITWLSAFETEFKKKVPAKRKRSGRKAAKTPRLSLRPRTVTAKKAESEPSPPPAKGKDLALD